MLQVRYIYRNKENGNLGNELKTLSCTTKSRFPKWRFLSIRHVGMILDKEEKTFKQSAYLAPIKTSQATD